MLNYLSKDEKSVVEKVKLVSESQKVTFNEKIEDLEQAISEVCKPIQELQERIESLFDSHAKKTKQVKQLNESMEEDLRIIDELQIQMQDLVDQLAEKSKLKEKYQNKIKNIQDCKTKAKTIKKDVKFDNVIEIGIKHYIDEVPVVVYDAKQNVFILDSCREKFNGEFTKTTMDRMNAYLDGYKVPFYITYRGSKANRQFFVHYKGKLHPFDKETYKLNMTKLFPDFKVDY